ncbi:uncharacterized protein J7T54_001131, partial [Emericellopsis cladophorae]
IPLPLFFSPCDYHGHYAYSSLRVVLTFVSRPTLHDKLREQIGPPRADADGQGPRIAVVWGIGGVGKSQLVLDYHLRHRHEYSASFWVDASRKQTIDRDFLAISKVLFNVPDSTKDDVRVEDAILAVKKWFSGGSGRWIFVFDGADNIGEPALEGNVDITHYFPDVSSIDIILVSRSGRVAKMVHEPVRVAELETEQAKHLFLARAGLGPTIARDAIAEEIVTTLGCLALALSLSGTYVSKTARLKKNLDEYLKEYRQRRKQILSRKPALVKEYGESVLTTWETTYDAIVQGG